MVYLFSQMLMSTSLILRHIIQCSHLCCRFISKKAHKTARKETVFQHVGKNASRTDRVYGWGLSKTGALGNIGMYC